jgi:hypothetical protein
VLPTRAAADRRTRTSSHRGGIFDSMQSARVQGAFASTVDTPTSPRVLSHLGPAREQPLQDARVGRPRLKEHSPRDLACRVSEGERDDEHIVERTDDRQELGNQIDG